MSMLMTEAEAVAVARKAAEAEGWTWAEPVHAELSERPPTRPTWQIFTNAFGLGTKVRVVVHAQTGEVLEKGYLKR
jgi:hypothetical protein